MIFSCFLSKKKSVSAHQICLSVASRTSGNPMYRLQLPLFIAEKDWDDAHQRPVNIYCKKYKKLHLMLNRIKIRISELITEKPSISVRAILAEIRRVCSDEVPVYPENSFLFLMDEYLKQKKKSVCLSTYRRYQVFMRLMEKFEGFLCRRIFPEEIDSSFLTDFYAFGRKEEYTESTLHRSAEFVKTILNFAELQGVRTNVRQLEIPRFKVVRKVMILDEKEIKKVRQSRVPKKLQQAKDWLVISCFTGQRISDFMKFNTHQLLMIDGKKCISFIQQKTGKEIILPLHPVVLKIMGRYGNAFPNL